MILVRICLFAVIITSGYQHPANKKIVVTGKALNAMGGAIVVGADSIPYYLEGKDHWDHDFYGKKIRVSGILVIEHNKPQTPTAQVILTKPVIKKPKWELLKN